MQAVRVADKYWNILEGPMKKLEAEAESKSSSFCSVYAWQRLEPSVTARIRVACGLEICVESTANLRYTAGRDGQGPQHNLQSDILSRFSACLPSGALVVYSFSGPRRFFAGPGTRPYRSGEATHPVVPERPGAFFSPWAFPRGVNRISWYSIHGQCQPYADEQN